MPCPAPPDRTRWAEAACYHVLAGVAASHGDEGRARPEAPRPVAPSLPDPLAATPHSGAFLPAVRCVYFLTDVPSAMPRPRGTARGPRFRESAMFAPRQTVRATARDGAAPRFPDDTNPLFVSRCCQTCCSAVSPAHVTTDISHVMDRQLASAIVVKSCGNRAWKCRFPTLTDGIVRYRTIGGRGAGPGAKPLGRLSPCGRADPRRHPRSGFRCCFAEPGAPGTRAGFTPGREVSVPSAGRPGLAHTSCAGRHNSFQLGRV